MRFYPTYNFLVLSLLAVFAAAGCSPLSKAQIEAVGELTFRSDTISRSPAVLFEEMSELRLERGLFYAASLTSGTARYEEVTALAETSMDDESLVRKASGYVDAFNSYVLALHSVSADARWKGLGTEIRGTGTRVDSVLYRYNSLDTGYEDIPTGYARMAGRVLAYVAEEVMQAVQGRAVRNIVVAGDTLVTASCDSLMAILRSDETRVTACTWNCSAAPMNCLTYATAASRPCARSRTPTPSWPLTSPPGRRKSTKNCGKRC